jgi:hypothetical protein
VIQRAQARDPAGEVIEQLAGGRVGPVDVLDHEQHPVVVGRDREQACDRLEQAQLRLLGISGLRRPAAVGELGKEL